jgi:hypothetical protein
MPYFSGVVELIAMNMPFDEIHMPFVTKEKKFEDV